MEQADKMEKLMPWILKAVARTMLMVNSMDRMTLNGPSFSSTIICS